MKSKPVEVKVKVLLTEGYQKRFTQAILDVNRRRALGLSGKESKAS